MTESAAPWSPLLTRLGVVSYFLLFAGLEMPFIPFRLVIRGPTTLERID